MTGRLAGKVAFITGAGQGIGARAAQRFVAEGASVAIADIDQNKIEAAARDLGDAALPISFDVAEADQWIIAVDRTIRHFGRLDILVANAGIAAPGPIETIPLELHRRIVDVNVNGIFYGMRAVIPVMRGAGGGSIINMSSIDGMIGVAGLSSYAGSKWAVRGMTRSAALELGQHGIRVNSVHPGVIETPLLGAAAGSPALRSMIERQPVPRIGTTDDVAEMLLFLASDASAYCTGGEFVIDGGQLAGPVRG